MHEPYIRRCLELAEQGRGRTGINPMVGAVLVRDGAVIAEGFHEAFGKHHAERQLVEKFDQKIRSTDTLYVNLEPCCHTAKKTPPCTSLLMEKGVKNVVIGMVDPNPEVAGKGIALLRSHGIRVTCPVLPVDCARFNRGFVSLQKKNRPWITLKRARTVGGVGKSDSGVTLKITSTEQDAWSHRHLRAKHDAILVGIGTVRADNPSLTIRHGAGRKDQRLLRIVLDPTLKISLDSKVVSDHPEATILVCGSGAEDAKCAELFRRGVKVLRISMVGSVFDWRELWTMLTASSEGFSGVSSILVEGGAVTSRNFFEAGMVDEEVVLVGGG